MDTLTPEHRSWVMSRIRSKDTKPEKIVRSWLHRNGYRFRLHVKSLPGHPDIVLPKYRTLIEVRGCFWHRHKGCATATSPKSNIGFWRAKFRRNVTRDRRHEAQWAELGWNTVVVWECGLVPARREETLRTVGEFLESRKTAMGADATEVPKSAPKHARKRGRKAATPPRSRR